MAAINLDTMTSPDVREAIAAGRDTVVFALGATEQHGPHLPLATDALIGDHLAMLIAERLDAFVGPTVRVGCSSHHLEFPGTLSVDDETFHGIVHGLVRSAARGGFARVVLIPTHGGNFAPLGEALNRLEPDLPIRVSALTDVRVLLAIAQTGEEEFGVPLSSGGLHAGEWETSLLMAARPDLVHSDRGEPGYTGDLDAALGAVFGQGVHAIAPNGVIGDPSAASSAHGDRYWARVVEIVLDAIA
jgi:creatinine amidohydrolase/Fe(II)-dependent formamide hydrolase-like protein